MLEPVAHGLLPGGGFKRSNVQHLLDRLLLFGLWGGVVLLMPIRRAGKQSSGGSGW